MFIANFNSIYIGLGFGLGFFFLLSVCICWYNWLVRDARSTLIVSTAQPFDHFETGPQK